VQDLMPGNASPDMASLRLCKESELRRGQIIGSGAFGTVYKVCHARSKIWMCIVVAVVVVVTRCCCCDDSRFRVGL